MDLMDWVFLFALLDGPAMGVLYLLWRKFNNEIK